PIGARFRGVFSNMTDNERFAQLLDATTACVSIVSFEEQYALSVVREVAMERGLNLRIWSVTRGLRDGLVEDAPVVADTDHPAAALYTLSNDRKLPQGIAVFLDLCGHLRDERTLRAFREAVEARSACGDTIVLIDQNPELPPVVRNFSVRMDL